MTTASLTFDVALKLPLQPLDLTRRSGSVGAVRLNCQGCKAAGAAGTKRF